MLVQDLVAGDIIRLNGENYRLCTFIGASESPDNDDWAIVVWWDHSDNLFTTESLPWKDEAGFLTSYRNNNKRQLNAVLSGVMLNE